MGRRILVGDIQGCREELEALLEAVAFEPGVDRLLPLGDLVGRGPDALGTLRLLGRQQRALDDLQGRIAGAARRQLARRREQVEGLEARRGALDPARVLDRGFAWVTDAEGALVRRGDQIPVGGRLRIRLAVGGLEAIRIEKDEQGGQDG